MKKNLLAQILEVVSQCNKREYDIHITHPSIWDKYGKEGKKHFVESASNAAGTQLVQGKVSLKTAYLVSRGKQLPFPKPDAVAEYSSHWPYDFCYFYRL